MLRMLSGEKNRFMNNPSYPKPLSSRIKFYFLLFSGAWTGIIFTLFLNSLLSTKQKTRDMARREAAVHFNKDLAARLWAASHGGVYVPATDETPPNPFLAHVSERDITTPGGKFLTLMNPAYMIRQMMNHYSELYGVRGHITGLKYFSEKTAPDDWEKTALAAFANGAKEMDAFKKLDGKPYFRFMKPLFMEEQCLKCHGAQGYKIGDVRGGVSVSVPMTSYLYAQKIEIIGDAVSFSILWILGILGIVGTARTFKIHALEKEKSEYLLAESQENYRTLVENSLTGIYIVQDGIIKFVNNRTAEIYGYEKKELIGIDAMQVVHPCDKERVKEIRKKRFQGDLHPQEYEIRCLRKNGDTIWVQRRITSCDYYGRPAILGNVLDITALKRSHEESEKHARELERSNRELEQFASVASHDLSEPLRKIRSFGSLLRDKYADSLDDTANDYLGRMQNASERMQYLMEALLSYSRVTTKAKPFSRVNLSHSLKEALSNLEIAIQKTGGTIHAQNLPTLEADPYQMVQLFQNLIGNSLKFHRPGTAPVISIQAEKKNSSKNISGRRIGTIWKIRIMDNGIGLDKKQLEKIFLPFERLHGRNEYAGAGMGLAICKKIVERHGGTLTADIPDTDDSGALFIITLPEKQLNAETEPLNN